VNQILQLAGCDLLTISPELLEQLEHSEGILERKLDPVKAAVSKDEHLHLDEKTFRWMHNEDAMATEKLAEGIRKFNSDSAISKTMHFPKWRRRSVRLEARI
jgi:transaldolase